MLIAAALLTAAAGNLPAQQIRLAKQRGPYYVGDPVIVQISVAGMPAGVTPHCRLKSAAPGGISVDGPRVGRSSSVMTRSINGRVTRSESTNYRFNFLITARQAGEFVVGPFLVEVDGKEQEVEGTSLRFEKLENDPDMQIAIRFPRDRIYVGQRVPMTIRWAFAGELRQVQYAFSHLQIRSPLFDQFRFEDRRPSSRTTLTIATAKGEVEIDAESKQQEIDGKPGYVVTGVRTLIADAPGKVENAPVTCRTKKVTGWGRDFFGDLVARGTQPALAAGLPVSLTILPVPTAGRPPSFSGAVGSGFTVDVAADRSVVRVGDPIRLDITVQGDGNLERISLPPLSADDGLPSERFALPAERPAGEVQGNRKLFQVSVRVKDLSVKTLPAIAFSWFDPETEKFATARSQPIALQVQPAQVVSAADVVSSQPSRPSGRAESPQTARKDTVSPAVGANLAIETDTGVLLRDSGGHWTQRFLLPALYLLGVAMVAAAWIRRRAAQEDPAEVERRIRLRNYQRQIRAAANLPPRAAAETVAVALRGIIAEVDPPSRDEADALIAECDARIYAPEESDSADGGDWLSRAAVVADRLVRGEQTAA